MRKTDEETSLASGAHPPALQVTGRGMLRGPGGGQGREEAHSQRGGAHLLAPCSCSWRGKIRATFNCECFTGNVQSLMCLSVCLRRKRLHACRVNFGGNNFVRLLPLPRLTAPSFPPAVPSLRFASPSTPSSPTSSNRLAVRQNPEVLLITKVSALRKKSGQNEVT